MIPEISRLILDVLKHPEDCEKVFERILNQPPGNFRRLSVVVAQKGSLLRGFIQDFLFMREKGNDFLLQEAQARRDHFEIEFYLLHDTCPEDIKGETKVRMARLESFSNHIRRTSRLSDESYADMMVIRRFLKDCHITVRLHDEDEDKVDDLVKTYYLERDSKNSFTYLQVQFDNGTNPADQEEVIQLFKEAATP